ncbi:hypothetical protein [Lactococcus lactis]|uniref:hypothetical protein n=1 Tax=Lactococcus lactis TaxID=1358 RepID=UPI0018A9963B|nr:hypothetical protein [Lactococcus lactis]MDR7695786.1 hypothetical protein [Lactococcus lactis]
MNKNTNQFQDFFNKINNRLGRILMTISLIIVGIVVEKIWNSLPNMSTLFNHDIYTQFHDFSYKIFFLWLSFAIFSVAISIFCLYKAITSVISKNYIKFLGFIMWGFLCVYNFSTSASTISAINENRAISTNLEIVRPYISNDDYLKLKSQYLQINSKKSFDKVSERIRYIANKHDANINEYE